MTMNKSDSILRAPWLYDVDPFEIVPGLYYVGNKSVSSHLFDTGDGLLLLDSGYPSAAYLLLESIRSLGFDPRNIKWILHTHAHIDHFGATRYLKEKYGCITYLPAADLPLLNERGDLNCCADLGLPYSPPYDTWFPVDVTINPGDTMHFGNLTVTARSAAGHTPGTMAYFFDLPCGFRAAMHGGIGWNTLNSAYTKAHNLDGSWREAYLRSLADLKNIPVEITLGNHPNQSRTFEKEAAKTDSVNPFIDIQEWNRTLTDLETETREFFEKDPL